MEISETVKHLEELKKESEKYEKRNAILLFALVACPFFFVSSARNALLACTIVIIAVIITGSRVSKYRKQYRNVYTEVFVKKVLEEKLEDVYYDWQRGFTGVELYDSQLFKSERSVSDGYLKASYKGVKFEQADVKHYTGGKHPRVCFHGKVMKFTDCPIEVSSVWIYTKSFDYSARCSNKFMKMIAITDDETAQFFDIYADNEADVERILTPQFKEKVMLLAKKNRAVGMYFKENKFYIGIDTGRDTFQIYFPGKKIDYDMEMDKIRKDADDILEVMELLVIS